MSELDDYYKTDDPIWLNTAHHDGISKHFLDIRAALQDITKIDDYYVPVKWLAQFPGAQSMQDVAHQLGQDNYWHAITDMHRWADDNDYRRRIFIGTLNYMATGEGSTLRVIVDHASSLGEFIYSLEGKVDLYYLKGMQFHETVPDSDYAFDTLISFPMREVIERDHDDGVMQIDLSCYINFS